MCSASLQINPTKYTILLSIFISLLNMFRATTCPSSGEITLSMRHWYLSLCMGGVCSAGWSETVISPDDGHMVCPKHVEKGNKYTEQN